jgi:hypothetical protein
VGSNQEGKRNGQYRRTSYYVSLNDRQAVTSQRNQAGSLARLIEAKNESRELACVNQRALRSGFDLQQQIVSAAPRFVDAGPAAIYVPI